MSEPGDLVDSGRLALERARMIHGADDPKTLEVEAGLGRALYLNQDFDEAEDVLRRVVFRQQLVLLESDDAVLRSQLFLAAVYYRKANYEDAIEILNHVVDIASSKNISDDEWPLNPGLADLSRSLASARRFSEQIPVQRRVCDSYQRLLRADDLRILEAKTELATALRSTNEFAQALPIDIELMSEWESRDSRSRYLGTRFNVALDLLGVGDTEQGELVAYETYQAIMEELPSGDPVRTAVTPTRKEIERYGKRIRRASKR